MPQTESAEIPTNELSNASQDKPTVREQIKKQVEERTDSVSRPNGLTKIDKGESRKKTESKGSGKLTPIEDKIKKDISDNPLTPANPNKDNITENPLNN